MAIWALRSSLATPPETHQALLYRIGLIRGASAGNLSSLIVVAVVTLNILEVHLVMINMQVDPITGLFS